MWQDRQLCGERVALPSAACLVIRLLVLELQYTDARWHSTHNGVPVAPGTRVAISILSPLEEPAGAGGILAAITAGKAPLTLEPCGPLGMVVLLALG